jgi:hypothetical protein
MGCEASGTTLLSLILDSHSRIAVCRGTSYYSLFASERRYYGSLRNRANVIRLIKDFRETAKAHHVDPPEVDAMLQALPEPTFEGVLVAFLQLYARQRGKVRAGERSPKHYRYLPEILAGYPDSPIFFTMRDPRDVALAHKGFGFDIAAAAASWNDAFQSYRAASGRPQLVRYEDLVREPEQTVEAVCASLGERFEPGMLRFYERTPAHYRGLPHHQRLFGPLDPGFVGEFRQLSDREIEAVEERCAVGMDALGYERVRPRRTDVQWEEASESVAFFRRVRNRLGYYGWDRQRWSVGLRHRNIVLRARVRYVLHLGYWRDDW